VSPVSTLPTLRLLLELVAVASLCGWCSCLVIGMSLFTPDKAILIGISGVIVGGGLWQTLALPTGPSLGHFAVVPSLFGTLVVALVTELVSEIRDSPFRRSASASAPPAAAAGVPPAAERPAAAPQSSPVLDATREAR